MSTGSRSCGRHLIINSKQQSLPITNSFEFDSCQCRVYSIFIELNKVDGFFRVLGCKKTTTTKQSKIKIKNKQRQKTKEEKKAGGGG